ncbi:IS110 family transposase [Pontibacterium sp.]|uniref:IS110 family transposase n=1 Tax=Pontibacterium sp. TaxID=2036026 RepID=UPI003517327E
MDVLNQTSFTAFIGIDWADSKHDICIQSPDISEREFDVISHQVERIDEWALAMRQRFGSPIAVAVELSKGPIVYALQKHDCFVIFPVNPSTLARYREAFQPSRAKDDPTDAELAVDLIVRHPERFKPLRPQSVELRMLASLVEQRRNIVDDKIRITNRLRSVLKQYYPQVLDWFDHIDTPLFCDFITRWPTLIQAKRARTNTLKTFFNTHNMRFPKVLETRLKAIKTAIPLTLDDAVIIPHRLQALVLVEQLKITLDAIKQYDKEIAEVAPKHVDYELFSSLPGAGPSLAPRLLVAFGEQRERYQTASDLQTYAGVAPVTERSGKKLWVHWRWQCPTFLRQTFVEWAAQTINKSFWAGEYYQQQRSKGCTYQAAVRALAFKWIRILYRCWKARTPYNESLYLKALERRGSPLLKGMRKPESA